MAKSFTLHDSDIKELSDIIASKVYSWIKQQVVLYSEREIQVSKDCYRIGNYMIQKVGECWELHFYDNYYGAFMSKKHALLCCYYHRSNDLTNAMDIRQISSDLIEKTNDHGRYLHMMKFDNQKCDTYLARIKQNEKMINTLNERISLHLTKISFYKKLGNKNESQQH